MTKDTSTQLNSDFTGRKKEIEELCEYFPEPKDEVLQKPVYPHVVLCGPPSTGKTAILLKLMQIRKYPYVLVNCVQCRVEDNLYSQLLYALDGKYLDDFDSIDSLESVSMYFQKYEDTRSLRCIIFKNSTELNKSKIQELCLFQESLLRKGWIFSLVFISEDDDHLVDLNRSCVTTFFPRYTEEQLFDILIKECPMNDVDVFQNFLRLLLSAVTPVFQDLCDLKRLISRFYTVYKKPIDEGVLRADDVSQLTRRILPHLKIGSSDVLYSYPQKDTRRIKNSMELPLAAKYLLISAFLCSFVPKSEDKKLFSTISSKSKKRVRISYASDVKLGPKAFSFPRLLAIYRAIIAERTSLNLNLISQVATLVDLKLIALVGNGKLDETSFKCIASFDCVNAIAKNADIDLAKYISS